MHSVLDYNQMEEMRLLVKFERNHCDKYYLKRIKKPFEASAPKGFQSILASIFIGLLQAYA